MMNNKDYYFIVTLQYHVNIEAKSKEEARFLLNEMYIDQGIELQDEEIKLMKKQGDKWIKDPNQPYEEYINTYDK